MYGTYNDLRMISLVFALFIALIFSYFALQNTQPVTLRFQEYVITNIPVYIALITSMVFGVVVSLLFSLADSISNGIIMFGKDQKLRSSERIINRDNEKIRQLEAEVSKLRTAAPIPFRQSAFAKPNFFQRFRHRLSV